MPLKSISVGWQWLETALNHIIAQTNRQKPLGSATIAVEESPQGTLLKVIGQQVNQPQQDAGQQVPQPPPQPNQIKLSNVTWQTVTVVDPGTCAQSTISVLAQQSGQSVTLDCQLITPS